MSSIQVPCHQETSLSRQAKIFHQGVKLIETLTINFHNPSTFLTSLCESLDNLPSGSFIHLSVDSIFLTFLSFFPGFSDSLEMIKSHLIAIFQYSESIEIKFQNHLNQLTSAVLSRSQSMIKSVIGASLSPGQVFGLLKTTELFQIFKSLPLELVLHMCQSTIEKSVSIESIVNIPSIFSMLIRTVSPLLPIYTRPKFTLVLDLDETLGHYYQKKFLLRPGVHQFIDLVSQSFELVLFTAARSDYADWAMKIVDPQCKIFLRLYSQHTTDSFIKDLESLGRDLEKVIIVDNFSKSFEKQPANGILIKTWTGDDKDFELLLLAEKLATFAKSGSETVREFVFIAQEIVHTSIFGNTGDLGYYYVDLWVGTPPVKQTVIIDTGSRLTAFPCAGCTDCGTHMDKYFDFKNSSTSKPVTCQEDKKCYGCSEVGDSCRYSVAYAEGSSISGILMQDFIIFGDDFEHSHKVFMTFGCHRRETHLFRTQLADGIMGLGSGNGEKPTVVELMYKDHDVSDLVFTICFAHDGGFMTVGGFNSSRHSDEAQWTKLYETPYYGVVALGMKVGGQDTHLERDDFTKAYETGSIVDSGTTFTYLCYRVYSTLFEFFSQYCKEKDKCLGERVRVSGEPHFCFVYSQSEHKSKENFFRSFPVITFLFDGAQVDWKPERYLFAWPETPKTFCVGVYNNGGSGNVLGGIFMRGHDVIFDKGKSRLGFAVSDCEFKNKENTTYIEDSNTWPEEHKSTTKNMNRNFFLVSAAVLVVFLALCLILVCRLKKTKASRFEILQNTPEPSVGNLA